MRKVLVVSLLLMCIFFISSADVAMAVEEEFCQWFRADVRSDSEILGSWEDCIEICIYPDGWAEAWTDCNYPDYLICTLEDLGSDGKNLVCASEIWPKSCHASLGKRGNNLEADCALYMFDGITIHVRGVPDDNCRCEEPAEVNID